MRLLVSGLLCCLGPAVVDETAMDKCVVETWSVSGSRQRSDDGDAVRDGHRPPAAVTDSVQDERGLWSAQSGEFHRPLNSEPMDQGLVNTQYIKFNMSLIF